MGKSIVDELIASPEPHCDLPRPATYPELIAAAMMVAGHRKAGDLGVSLGIHLANALHWMREPGDRLRLRLVEGGPGDNWAPRIASAMLTAGRAAAEELGREGDVDAARRKLESMACPCCDRSFGDE